MDPNEASGSRAPDAKRQKPNDKSGPSGIAAIDAPNQPPVEVEQTADIFNMDIDCFEESFDYLPLQDLSSVGKTCKRLQRVAGYCFQQNYSGRAYCDSDGIKDRFHLNGVDVTHFIKFIQKVEIDPNVFQYFFDLRSEFQRLQQIKLYQLETADVNRMKEIPMSKLEVLCMWRCDLDNNFHEIIDQCKKLKRLEIDYYQGEFNWNNRQYPTLEYLRILSKEKEFFEGIAMFLELNPNIRKFATDAEVLLRNRDKFLEANIKLDDLAIIIMFPNDARNEYLQSMCDLFNELHERGFYNRLQLYLIPLPNEVKLNRLATLNGLVKLHVDVDDDDADDLELPGFTNLEELNVCNTKFLANLEILADNLINLKRICFENASIDAIMPFIRRSVEMQKIMVYRLEGGVHFNEDTGIIDLRALNRQREQLPDADKITLYVCEEVYLATKWTMKETDFGLIRLKRVDSFDWDKDLQLLTYF